VSHLTKGQYPFLEWLDMSTNIYIPDNNHIKGDGLAELRKMNSPKLHGLFMSENQMEQTFMAR